MVIVKIIKVILSVLEKNGGNNDIIMIIIIKIF